MSMNFGAFMLQHIDLERPHLKLFGGNAAVVTLVERDLVKQPVSAAIIGNMLGPVREHDLAVDGVAIPIFRAGKLAHDFG
jgi:hypothetical protein